MAGFLTLAAALNLPYPPVEPLSGVMNLDEIGLYQVGCRYQDGRIVDFPIGWTGDFDEATGVSCRTYGVQFGRAAALLHCPWRGGTGASFQEFSLRIPIGAKAALKGGIAMSTASVGKSDGARFTISANGDKIFDQVQKSDAWKDFSLDLSAFAGEQVLLRFETSPGPKGDSSFDFSLWSERKIILEGVKIKGPAARPVPPEDLLAASSGGARDVVPSDGDTGTATVRPIKDGAVFNWAGPAGTLEYTWLMPAKPEDPLLGSLVLKSVFGGRSTETLLASQASVEWASPATPTGVKAVTFPGGAGLERTYLVNGKPVRLAIRCRLVGKCLTLAAECDQPVVKSFDSGGWGPTAYRRQITVPFYSGHVSYLPQEDLFVNGFLDWTASSASLHEGSRAVYNALTDGSRRLLKERAVYAASWRLSGALPSIPNSPSPYIAKVGGRLVLDVWGGTFASIEEDLKKLADYGVRDTVSIIHVWQRSGYDNALPAHYPASADQGGDEAMKKLVQTGVRLGSLMALHENYVDYYPNYEGFDEKDIALDSSGNRVLAWYQSGTKIQSFAVKPTAMLKLAASQSTEIHKRYGTNASYLDVHSAVPPWFHVDQRAGEPGAGQFSEVLKSHQDLFAFERRTHGGPVFGEGNNHWYWSGMLDGAEAQFGSGWPSIQGETAPLMVDFNLLRVHPLQGNHGMGYYERWWSEAPWNGMPPLAVLDQYRMQQVAYGHAPFLAGSTWNSIPYAWLESNLVSPVAAAYAGVRPKMIQYFSNGKWVDGSSAAKTGTWERVRVTYANGLIVTANSSASPLQVDGVALPKHGWIAKGAGVQAGTYMRDGVLVDSSETTDRVFVNARNAASWNLSSTKRIRPTSAGFLQTASRKFQMSLLWDVREALERDYSAFVHFSDLSPGADNDGTRFQADHNLPLPTSQWKPGSKVQDGPWDVAIPASVPDGDYSVGVGLFLPQIGRVSLEGPVDGHQRIEVGTLTVKDGGQTILFRANRAGDEARQALYLQSLNTSGKVIDFGSVRTNGSASITREGGRWVIRTFPKDSKFTLQLSTARFGVPSGMKAVNGFWGVPTGTGKPFTIAAGPASQGSGRPKQQTRG